MINCVEHANPIDLTCIEERKTLVARLLVATMAGAFLYANFSYRIAIAWLFTNMLCEAWSYYATANITEHRRGTLEQRFHYTIAVIVMTLNWTSIAVLYWFKQSAGYQIIAVVTLSAQLIHAQAFTFRSTVMMLVSAGIPAFALIFLTTVFGNSSGLEAVTLGVGLLMILGYVMASAHSNLISQKALARAHAELAEVAYIDALTGLINRRMFNEEFARQIVNSAKASIGFALILIDLDKFKQINDRHGHGAGDAMLIAATHHFRTAIRKNDIAARLGGDEFAILLPGVEVPADVQAICERIIFEFCMPIDFDGILLNSSPSIGFALFPMQGMTQEELLKAADRGLYDAKRDGGNRWRQALQNIAVEVPGL